MAKWQRRRAAEPSITERKSFVAPTGTAWVTLEHAGNSVDYTLRTVGEFDVETVSCLHDALRVIPQTRSGRTIIDVSQVGFGDSSFLEALIRAHFQERTLILAGPLPPELRRLLQLTGALRMFHIEPHEVS
ncbi:STAS domain-containing protein [Streptomyces sp. NPDC056527]|uniref:STAS domain-containing protein n=1 Tax=Streptomyces sp. NPDC056527 TaxID=3345853 RepID=UPI003690D632